MSDATWLLLIGIVAVLISLLSTIVRGLSAKAPPIEKKEAKPQPEDEEGEW